MNKPQEQRIAEGEDHGPGQEANAALKAGAKALTDVLTAQGITGAIYLIAVVLPKHEQGHDVIRLASNLTRRDDLHGLIHHLADSLHMNTGPAIDLSDKGGH